MNFQTRYCRTSTPWGTADSATTIAPGIIFYGTPSHGGLHLSPSVNEQIPLAFREGIGGNERMRGWYEEDVAVDIPVAYLRTRTEDFMAFWSVQKDRREAFLRESIRNVIKYFPFEYELAEGRLVYPGESPVKDEYTTLKENRDGWFIRAVLSDANSNHDGVPPEMSSKVWLVSGESAYRTFMRFHPDAPFDPTLNNKNSWVEKEDRIIFVSPETYKEMYENRHAPVDTSAIDCVEVDRQGTPVSVEEDSETSFHP